MQTCYMQVANPTEEGYNITHRENMKNIQRKIHQFVGFSCVSVVPEH
jgi:hypothetical protein